MAKRAKVKYATLETSRKNAKSPNNRRLLMKAFRFEIKKQKGILEITLGGRLPVSSRKFLDDSAEKEIPLYLSSPRGGSYYFSTLPNSCQYAFHRDGFALLKLCGNDLSTRVLRKISNKKNH